MFGGAHGQPKDFEIWTLKQILMQDFDVMMLKSKCPNDDMWPHPMAGASLLHGDAESLDEAGKCLGTMW